MTSKKKTNSLFLKLNTNIVLLVVFLLIFFIFGAVTKTKQFLNLGNFQTMAKQFSEYGLMALGVSICMISGGIDLSVVYMANLSAITAGIIMRDFAVGDANVTGVMLLAIAVGLLVGLVCGIFNGILIAQLGVPAMLATLGTSQMYMGLGVIFSNSSTVKGIPKAFTNFGKGMLFDAIPYSFIIFLIVIILVMLFMKYTTLGTKIYLVGTNTKSAQFAGINNKSVLIKTYMISGLLCAIAGLMSLARITSAKADFGESYTMQCILISVLGGVNPDGGFGSILGVALAILLLQMLSSLLNMFPNANNLYLDLIWGAALLVVLILNKVVDDYKVKRLQKMI